MKTNRGRAEIVRWVDATEYSSWAEAGEGCAVAETLGWVQVRGDFLAVTMTAYKDTEPSDQDGPVIFIPKRWVVSRDPL